MVREAVDRAFAVGIFQHRGEIEPFAEWLAPRWPHHVLEIGGLHGGTATLWHALATGRVISIDLPGGEFGGAAHNYDVQRCEQRNAGLAADLPRFVGILGDSHSDNVRMQVEGLLDAPIDMLFIDGDHSYLGVRLDYEMYRPFVRKGGVVVFHDILDTPMHRAHGCEVDVLWKELPGQKMEFSVNGPWGGIGVLRV
jgi:predicted O-methyltransferase YrrM